MTWGHAKSAVRRVLLAFSSRGIGATKHQTGSLGRAPITAKPSEPHGERILTRAELIERRALRKAGNTRPETIRAYNRVHMALSRGNCFK